MRSLISIVAVALTVAGCASTPPSHHPSAAQLDELANKDEQTAREYVTAARVPARSGHCGDPATGRGASGWETCWTPNDEQDRIEAENHFRAAVREHAQAARMRDAQERACAGLSAIDREVSPFAHVKDIQRVDPIYSGGYLVGAKIGFRNVQNLTRESLQRIVDCHVAEADALGHEVPGESFCPLNLPDARAVVSDVGSGFEIDVTSDDRQAAKEILRRAQNLLR